MRAFPPKDGRAPAVHSDAGVSAGGEMLQTIEDKP